MRRANISIQTFFYILMVVFMILIVIFGFNQLTQVQDLLSERERLEVTDKLEETLLYCEDPLNRGDVKITKFENSAFDSFCLISEDDYYEDSDFGILRDDMRIILESGDNVMLLNSEIILNSERRVLQSYLLVDSLNIEMDIETTRCFFSNEQGVLEFENRC